MITPTPSLPVAGDWGVPILPASYHDIENSSTAPINMTADLLGQLALARYSDNNKLQTLSPMIPPRILALCY